MTTRAFLLLGGVIFLGVAPLAFSLRAESGPRHLEITGNHRLLLTYDTTFTWPRGDDERAVLYLPIPPNTGNQQIEHFTSTLKGHEETEGGENPPHHLLVTTLKHDADDARGVHWRVQITGQFQMRQLVDGPAPSTTTIIAPPEGQFLGSTESINWKADAFQAWLDAAGLRRHAGESAVDCGQRIYDYFVKHGRYSYPPETAWNAAAACRHLRTDCGGFSLVFTAACRANGIPARMLAGQWFRTRENGDGSLEVIKRQSHVIAEFFDPQIGWIPEDISSYFLKTPGAPGYDYFGRDPGYFFAWHFDTDFHFETPRKPHAFVQWLQNPSLWFSENADGASDNLSHHWTLETLQ